MFEKVSKVNINDRVYCGRMKQNMQVYKRENAFVKRSAYLTSMLFCQWVNEHLLANETLEPGCPRSISVETGRHWLHELGFKVLSAEKGCFGDGHKSADVVESRNKL